ncbi:MAG: FMN-dependent NADH-azoreductase [Verrucomicrobiota bacterium]|jgi:FMN-dependent NADH-azoreductase|nr:FMN-dependent NADH-azoreductase [Verrucomicrobiota bacterium]MDK2963699.1 FMN-dependent NADH-azoreductase [Verrucomicrobiota bacterium]
MNILHVCANPKPVEQSVSKQLAARFFGKLLELNPDVELNNIDLYQDKPPYYSNDLYRRMWMPVFDPVYEPSKAEDAALNYARKQIDELKKADVLVLTMPMWNFAAPALMKAWMDQILAPGLMFELTDEGPKPLHNITSIILLVASGGVYKEDDERDALTSQVRAAFGFIGISDIRIAWADGQNPLFFSDAEIRRDMAFDAAEELAEELAEESVEG